MTPSTQNLNAKLSVPMRPLSGRDQSTQTPRTSSRRSAPPVRISGTGSNYRGGYLLNNV